MKWVLNLCFKPVLQKPFSLFIPWGSLPIPYNSNSYYVLEFNFNDWVRVSVISGDQCKGHVAKSHILQIHVCIADRYKPMQYPGKSLKTMKFKKLLQKDFKISCLQMQTLYFPQFIAIGRSNRGIKIVFSLFFNCDIFVLTYIAIFTLQRHLSITSQLLTVTTVIFHMNYC